MKNCNTSFNHFWKFWNRNVCGLSPFKSDLGGSRGLDEEVKKKKNKKWKKNKSADFPQKVEECAWPTGPTWPGLVTRCKSRPPFSERPSALSKRGMLARVPPSFSFLVPRPRRGACCYGTPSDISLAVCFSRCWRGIYFIVTHISFFSVRKIFRPAYYAFQPFSSFFKWSRFFSGNQIYKFYGSSYPLINWIQTDQHSTQFDANDRRQCWRGWWTSWGGRRVSRAWNDRVATLRPSSAETTERDQLHRYHGFIIRQLNQFPFESFRWFNSIWTKS